VGAAPGAGPAQHGGLGRRLPRGTRRRVPAGARGARNGLSARAETMFHESPRPASLG
jgi:hypothetical protein